MDAANPRRRWARRLSLCTFLLAGCHLCEPKPAWDKSDDQEQVESLKKQRAKQFEAFKQREGRYPWEPAEKPLEKSRGQSPTDPVPGFPVPPVGPPPTSESSPIIAPTPPGPAAPIPSMPPKGEVLPAPGSGEATPASFVVPPNAAAMRQFVLNNKPQVKIVAIVGKGNIVTDEEVWQMVRQRPDHREALTSSDRETREIEMYRFELKKIIERELLVDDMIAKMKKNKPGALEEIKEFAARAADRSLRDYRRKLNIANEQEFEEKALIPQGLSSNVLRRQIERNTIAMEYVRSLVREQAKGIGLGDVREYYVKHPEKFQTKERVKWQDIFIAQGKFASPQEAIQHAESVRQQAASGADFAGLSKQHDHGDAAFRNGEGVGQFRGEIRPEELEPVVFQMQSGQVSAVLPSATGYHIVKVIEHTAAGIKPFDEKCQNEIREMLFDQMREQVEKRLTEDLWRKGAVQIVDVP